MKVTGQTARGATIPTDVMATETATRVTPSQGPTFGEVMQDSAQSLIRGASAAVRVLPMSPVVAASVRPPGAIRVSGAAGAGSAAGAGLELSAEAGGSGEVGLGAGGTSTPSVEAALERSQEMNLYFLQLQEQLAAENRAYTAYSNVLKARHETVKNAIGNIR